LTKIWDARTGELGQQLPDRLGFIPAFSPDGRWLSTDLDGGRLLEVGTWEPGPRLGGRVRFAADGRLGVSEDGSGGFRLVDIATGRRLATFADPHASFVEPGFSPDGGLLIGTEAGGTQGLRVWDLRLVRERLAEIGLDWDAPEIPPAADPSPAPITIEVRAGASHYDAGVALAGQRRLEEAAVELRKAIEAEPRHAAAHDELGSVLFDLKRTDDAIAHYRKSIELDSTRPSAHNNLGYALLTRGERDEAIACFQHAVDLLPGYVRAHDNLGNALRSAGRIDEAIAAYRTVAGFEPRCAHHANLLAWLLVTREPAGSGDLAEALEHASQAVKLEPGKGVYWNTLGVARYRAGEWESAIEALERSRTLQGEAHLAHDAFFLSMSHHRLDHDEDARAWLDRAIEWMERNAPSDVELRRFRAEAEELLGTVLKAGRPD
jgi:tetratricopeptide (TPR) repeat protein